MAPDLHVIPGADGYRVAITGPGHFETLGPFATTDAAWAARLAALRLAASINKVGV